MAEELVSGAEWTTVWRQARPRRRVAVALYGAVPWYEWWEGSLFVRFVGFDPGATTDSTGQLFRVPRVWVPTLMRTLRIPRRDPVKSLCELVDSQSAAEHLHGLLRGAHWVYTPGWRSWHACGSVVGVSGPGYPERLPSASGRRAVLHSALRRAFAEHENFLGAVWFAYRVACIEVTGEDEPTPRMCRWAYPEIAIVDWDDDTCDDPEAELDVDDNDVLSFAGVEEGISLDRGVNVSSYLLGDCDYWVVDANISYGIAPATNEGRLAMLKFFADEVSFTSLDECEYRGLDPAIEAPLRSWLAAQEAEREAQRRAEIDTDRDKGTPSPRRKTPRRSR